MLILYYRALQDGPASIVVPIDKLSILVTVAFSWLVFREKLPPVPDGDWLSLFAGHWQCCFEPLLYLQLI